MPKLLRSVFFLKLLVTTLLMYLWAAYLITTSIYCLLAYLPYTFIAVIKAPPYNWMPWFVDHHPTLFWVGTVFSGLMLYRKHRRIVFWTGCTAQLLIAIYLTKRPVLANLQNNLSAYDWSICFLALVIVTFALEAPKWLSTKEISMQSRPLLAYSGLICVSTVIALSSAVGGHLLRFREIGRWEFQLRELQLSTWSLLSHLTVALLLVSVLNLITTVSAKAARPRIIRTISTSVIGWIGLWLVVLRFLHSALNLRGWQAQLYASLFALAIVAAASCIVLRLSFNRGPQQAGVCRWNIFYWILPATLVVFAIAFPTDIGGGDWNGILQGTFTLFLWCALGCCAYYLLPLRRRYSVATMIAVMISSVFVYKTLEASAVLWAKPLGNTDEEIAISLDTYGAQDASFSLTRGVLDGLSEQHCDDLCRIMRQYTTVGFGDNPDLQFVQSLTAARQNPPNIFIFVIDSLRPDYLGAYNPRVDFTPNLDEFARDSIVLHRVFTQYSGTSLSEPAIWSGVELRQTHELQPFARINGLEKLAHADRFRMIISYDEILKNLLAPSEELIELDRNKRSWNSLEVCSTIQQVEHELDNRRGDRPILLYTQPKNVHQFAHNDLPSYDSDWHQRPGINNRIAYSTHRVDSCIGGFFTYLKKVGLYDSSIIILTSDHGDATGEFGRKGHGYIVYPEVIHVPLIIHLPAAMRSHVLYDDERLSTLTDITPSLYYLLGHRPLIANPLFGKPIFVESKRELEQYRRDELFVAGDSSPVFGVLDHKGRYLYIRNDYASQSFLFDLNADPNALHNLLTETVKQQYDKRIFEHWNSIASYYSSSSPQVGM